MRRKSIFTYSLCILLTVFVGVLTMRNYVKAASLPEPVASNITANDLLQLVNGLRTAHGLPALTVNSTLMSTAQSTAQQMADQKLSWHIGATSDRVKAAGYGGSSTVWATENFATGGDVSIEWIQQVWADDWHMIPMTNPIYCDLGAGVATAADGTVYYVVHAAYTSTRYCGEYIGPGGKTLPTIQSETQIAGGPTPEYVPTEIASNWIEPVITVTPNIDGELVHEVKSGQNLWTIATIYETTVELIKQLNNMSWETVYVGDFLLIPTPEYFALTPSVTPTLINTEVDPFTMATQSTEIAKFTVTPTSTKTLPPSEAIASEEDEDTPPKEEASMGTMIVIVFAIAAVVIVISFIQPWKMNSQPEEEDPLTVKVE